ncbi:hypothetical protein B1C78_03560 [Thioalkalivibrio denitrificans]|uniref:Uncharacterized protein n=1 Tax=Thioalkalivibrio denitrificans TaxID=108003 RepID=A0A1V3NRR8_9GAMM|nr:hypothetical protein [Thioalkalivibrio denitrificans]OOG27558.1 hypothetical protein B1C78_03560 [Thioalkalivibrio denitrificans]
MPQPSKPIATLLAALITMFLLTPAGQHVLGADRLTDIDRALEAIADSPFDEPLHLESVEEDDGVQGDIHALMNIPHEALVAALARVETWCEILFLHINVKACVHDADDGQLTLFMGPRRYQDPAVSEQIHFRFRVDHADDDRLTVSLDADRGPHGLRGVSMEVQAVPIDEDTSLLHMHYALRYGRLARTVLAVYFAFRGRELIGFTIAETDEAGDPVYVDGLRGMIERNTVRFYFALKTYFRYPDPDQLQARLEHWFDLTERHPDQLRIRDRDDYLAQKARERQDQEDLQATGGLPEATDPW